MFAAPGTPRPHYKALFQNLLELPPEELRKSQQAADLSFLHQGITFTVYGNDEGTERVFPNDLLPRIIPYAEWHKIENGLTQRIAALNLFLEDIYHQGRILADGIVPRDLVYSCKHFRREMRGLSVPRGIYVSICGTDLVRLPDGSHAAVALSLTDYGAPADPVPSASTTPLLALPGLRQIAQLIERRRQQGRLPARES